MTSGQTPHPLLPAAAQESYRRSGYWEDVTLAVVVRERALREPARPAIVGERALSYGELWESASTHENAVTGGYAAVGRA
jgi:non-ribosomal peptide synthetase component E (peptide arylation enzyme)